VIGRDVGVIVGINVLVGAGVSVGVRVAVCVGSGVDVGIVGAADAHDDKRKETSNNKLRFFILFSFPFKLSIRVHLPVWG